MDYWKEGLRKAVHAMIPELEGKPCVNGSRDDGAEHACRRFAGLGTGQDCFNGTCEWAEPNDARPEELTDGMAISCDCVRLGPLLVAGRVLRVRAGARGPVPGR